MNTIRTFLLKSMHLSPLHTLIGAALSGPLVKNNSDFYPPSNRNTFLDTTIDFINQQNLNNLSKNKNNLSKDDWQALKELKNDESIVIKEADKGGAAVLMDSAHYEQMI